MKVSSRRMARSQFFLFHFGGEVRALSKILPITTARVRAQFNNTLGNELPVGNER
jgi:hypothetical protein